MSWGGWLRLAAVLGNEPGSLHPGGLTLTSRMLQACALEPGARVLDLGCGTGATVAFLNASHPFSVVGLDPCPQSVARARRLHPESLFEQGRGEAIPRGEACFDCVLCECVLSVTDDRPQVLREAHRVLRPGGWLAVSDLHLRSGSRPLCSLPQGNRTCAGGALPQADWLELLAAPGFKLVNFEDHTEQLHALVANIILGGGSLEDFGLECCAGGDAAARPRYGYFMATARKRGSR